MTWQERLEKQYTGESRDMFVATIAAGVMVVAGIAAFATGVDGGYPNVNKATAWAFVISDLIAIAALTARPAIEHYMNDSESDRA